ncbi:hypothetical protein D915_000003 [Fasciola hepatica]|uniref:Uncharacterized protein n=1 Tax=Fasciola hepatica TaxID=6192 RepID=A0A4E0RYP5_FASHE|nr:hypothetical protein D915_000003 [Fasciola hepatica]
MRWLFRKHRKKNEDVEVQDLKSKEPKKSILRSKDRDSQQWQETNGCNSEMSVADLRNATVTGVRTWGTNKSQVKSQIPATGSLRSVNGSRDSERSRRSVLFLDEVLTRKKQQQLPSQSANFTSPSPFSSPTSIRTDTQTGTQQYFTFASYPASYQPSPVFAKREADSSGIELISRSPLPKNRLSSEDSWEIWSAGSTPSKDVFRNFSLTRRRKHKKQISMETYSPFSDGYGNLAPKDGVVADSTIQYTGSLGSSRPMSPNVGKFSPAGVYSPRGSNSITSGSSNWTAEKHSAAGLSQAQTLENEESIIKRPTYPRVIEPRVKSANCENAKHDTKHLSKCVTLIASNINLTDSNATLRPDRVSSGSLDTLSDRPRGSELKQRDNTNELSRKVAMHKKAMITRPTSPKPPEIIKGIPPPVPKRQPIPYTISPSVAVTHAKQTAYQSIEVTRSNFRRNDLVSTSSREIMAETPSFQNKHSTDIQRRDQVRSPSINGLNQCHVIVVTRPTVSSTSEQNEAQNRSPNPKSNHSPRVISIARPS